MSQRRKRWGAGTASLVLASTMAVSASALTSSAASAAPAAAGDDSAQSVIVVLKDQLAGTPADATHIKSRKDKANAAQHAVLGRLSGVQPTKLRNYTSVNGFAATVTAT